MSAAKKTVRGIARNDVLTLARNDKLSIADDLMTQKRVRHLPVLDEYGNLCGIVSQRDLFRGALVRALGFGTRAEEQMLETLLVKEAMTEDVVTVAPDATIAEAAALMIERRIGCLPLVEDGKLVGIVTESDFLRLLTE